MHQPFDPRAVLEQAGERLTRPRALVAAMVARRRGPFTAAELVEAGARPAIGRATVFRTLELFERLGVLERIDLPDGSHAYVTCRPTDHHHHVVCVVCGRSAELADPWPRGLPAEVERSTGYRLEEHRLELFGTCPDCQAREASADAAEGSLIEETTHRA